MSARIPFKNGDTFMLGCKAKLPTGAGADLLSVDVKSQVWGEKLSAPKVADLDVVWVDRPVGEFELWAPGDGLINNWPTGDLRIDIQYSWQQGVRTIRRSTETFYIHIEPDVTT